MRRHSTGLVFLALVPGLAAAEGAFPLAEVPARVEDGGYRYFEIATEGGKLNMRAEPSASAAFVASLSRGGMVVNLGCVAGEGRAWCDVQPVGGGPRGYVAADFLSPGPEAARGYDDSAERAGRGAFDATGSVACTQGGTAARCDFGVARGGGGDGTVVVTRPDGRSRAIFFTLGEAVGADTSEADPGDFFATRLGDMTTVIVGDEAYELFDAIVWGG